MVSNSYVNDLMAEIVIMYMITAYDARDLGVDSHCLIAVGKRFNLHLSFNILFHTVQEF